MKERSLLDRWFYPFISGIGIALLVAGFIDYYDLHDILGFKL